PKRRILFGKEMKEFHSNVRKMSGRHPQDIRRCVNPRSLTFFSCEEKTVGLTNNSVIT
ncbi:hypothetical protein RUM44_013316, partial [Polyplax serrata]